MLEHAKIPARFCRTPLGCRRSSLYFTAQSVAERGMATASCPSRSVRLSVTLKYRGHIHIGWTWNSAKIISRLTRLIISLPAYNMTDIHVLQRKYPQILAGTAVG